MIRITGPDRNRILSTFDRKETRANGQHLEQVTVGYEKELLCAPAQETGETVTINTYHEQNDARMIMKKALIMGMDVNVQVV